MSEAIWDGNGGTLDPQKATQRDMLIALHVKVDQVIIPGLRTLETWRRSQDDGTMSRGQKAAVLEVVTEHEDAAFNRVSAKVPIIAAAIGLATLIATIVLTLTTGGVVG